MVVAVDGVLAPSGGRARRVLRRGALVATLAGAGWLLTALLATNASAAPAADPGAGEPPRPADAQTEQPIAQPRPDPAAETPAKQPAGQPGGPPPGTPSASHTGPGPAAQTSADQPAGRPNSDPPTPAASSTVQAGPGPATQTPTGQPAGQAGSAPPGTPETSPAQQPRPETPTGTRPETSTGTPTGTSGAVPVEQPRPGPVEAPRPGLPGHPSGTPAGLSGDEPAQSAAAPWPGAGAPHWQPAVPGQAPAAQVGTVGAVGHPTDAAPGIGSPLAQTFQVPSVADLLDSLLAGVTSTVDTLTQSVFAGLDSTGAVFPPPPLPDIPLPDFPLPDIPLPDLGLWPGFDDHWSGTDPTPPHSGSAHQPDARTEASTPAPPAGPPSSATAAPVPEHTPSRASFVDSPQRTSTTAPAGQKQTVPHADESPGQPVRTPGAPSAPGGAPSASVGHDGNGGARGTHVVLHASASLRPPSAGFTTRGRAADASGRVAGLPATSPD